MILLKALALLPGLCGLFALVVGDGVRCGLFAFVVGDGVPVNFVFSQQAQVGASVRCGLFALFVGDGVSY